MPTSRPSRHTLTRRIGGFAIGLILLLVSVTSWSSTDTTSDSFRVDNVSISWDYTPQDLEPFDLSLACVCDHWSTSYRDLDHEHTAEAIARLDVNPTVIHLWNRGANRGRVLRM